MLQNELVGKKFVFDDGNTIEVIQVKEREVDNETHPWVTYYIYQGNSLPRKLVMREEEFLNNFGHLFGLREPPLTPP